MEIQHLKHKQHSLFLKDDNTADDQKFKAYCGICSWRITSAPFYACDLCGYYLHKSCAELPYKLNHSFHPSHPLILSKNWDFYNIYCDSCHRRISGDLWFRCIDECRFKMDIECAMMPAITYTEVEQKKMIEHFSHQHPLLLVQIGNNDQIICFGCQSTLCSNDPVYGCTKCKYFLHESCAKLPQQIQYSFHPDNNLLTLSIDPERFTCTLCEKEYFNTFSFKCQKCKCKLCGKCSSIIWGRTFKYKYHEHLLCFLERKDFAKDLIGQHCSNRDSYCKQAVLTYSNEFSCSSSFGFFCSECEFKVHLLCGPLPSMIKYDCHIHPLILVDSLVEDNFGEYYCDVCELERDPRIRVYYCEQCKYIAHVHCLVYEIAKTLTGDLRDVELKNPGDDIWNLTPVEEEQGTLKDLINALNETEQEKLKEFYKWDDKPFNDHTAQSKLGDEDINEILKLSRFNNEDFQEFLEKLFDSFAVLELKSSDLGLKLVTVKGYKIPLILAPVLKTLLDKFKDVSFGSEATREWKSFVYFILCQVLKEMCATNVADITRNLLQEWCYHLNFVYRMDFEIRFAVAHLFRVVVPAFFGHQAKRLEHEIPTILNQKIAEMKKGLEKCEEYRGSSTKSEFMQYCLNKDSELQWTTMREGLFTNQQAFFDSDNWWRS